MGQKKKNQRKQRNKKRAQERRASESENSEPDSELDKARRRAVHSEGEISDLEEKSKSKFLKELKAEQNIQSIPQAKKILRRANSSDTDDDVKVQSDLLKTVNSAGDSAPAEASGIALQSCVAQGESSEDERDNKTEDKKKKKKKKKGKKMTDAENCKTITKPGCSDFKNDLILELEM